MYRSIVILTGAGISAESGIETFRAADGLWHNHRVEDVATPEAFARDPALVHDFYNMRRSKLLSGEIHPNAAHEALGKLESGFNGEFLVVTQNIDDLHERGGTRNLIHMHGELLKKRCTRCEAISNVRDHLSVEDVCTTCGQRESLRPNIVWFGEMPFEMERICSALERSDLFVSIGTSGNVYPAAGFVEIANRAGAETIELNLEPSAQRSAFEYARSGRATELVPQYVEELLTQQTQS